MTERNLVKRKRRIKIWKLKKLKNKKMSKSNGKIEKHAGKNFFFVFNLNEHKNIN
jgi:hypothetical protein